MTNRQEQLEQRVRNAMIQHALMRWESAGMLAAAVLSTFLLGLFNVNVLGLPNATWLIVGLVAYVLLAYSSYTDEETGRQIVEALLRADFNPKKLRDKQLQAKIDDALEYRSLITSLINERRDTALKVQLETMADQFDDWIEEIYDLARRIDDYQEERSRLQAIFNRTRERVGQLRKRRKSVSDEKVLADIDKNIADMERQIETITSLENTMERARLRLENTLTAMATIYSQTLLLDVKDIDSSRYRHLQQEIATEVDELSDVLYAMDEVYSDTEI